MKRRNKKVKKASKHEKPAYCISAWPESLCGEYTFTESTGATNTQSFSWDNTQNTENKINMKHLVADVLIAGAAFYLVSLAYHIGTYSIGVADSALLHHLVVGFATVKLAGYLRK